MNKSNSRLGRGLGSLIAKGADKKTVTEEPQELAPKKSLPVNPKKSVEESMTQQVAQLPYCEIQIALIDPNPYQPRKDFNPEHIKELAASIRSEGLIQPIVVRQKGDRYELIAGERRWRACQELGYNEIAARIMKVTDASSAAISLIENLQRQNLNPIDEAQGYASLMNDFDLTQEEVSQRVGKARATVANMLRLTQLESEIQGYLAKGILTAGHAKAVLSVENPVQRALFARRIIEGGLSVREAERLAKNFQVRQGQAMPLLPLSTVQSAVIKDLQKQISSHLNTKVQIHHTAKKGKLVIEYLGNEDLHRILEKIGFMKLASSKAV